MPKARVEGVYPVPGAAGVHLVEVLVEDSAGAVDVGSFTQSQAGVDRLDWQVPYDERLVTDTGEVLDLWRPVDEAAWVGDVRIVFFFHLLDLSRPLEGPYGALTLPTVQPLPARLASIRYEPPR